MDKLEKVTKGIECCAHMTGEMCRKYPYVKECEDGVAGLREIPRHEYQVAMNQINIWNNALVIRDIVKEVRERTETQT